MRYTVFMTKNPLINALSATLYIVFVSSILYYGTIFKVGNNSLVAPIALISLFTFSVAVMGYLFFYQSFILYFAGKQKLALDLFFKTLLIFGSITIAIFAVLFFSSILIL
jgi:hypothetical protein